MTQDKWDTPIGGVRCWEFRNGTFLFIDLFFLFKREENRRLAPYGCILYSSLESALNSWTDIFLIYFRLGFPRTGFRKPVLPGFSIYSCQLHLMIKQNWWTFRKVRDDEGILKIFQPTS